MFNSIDFALSFHFLNHYLSNSSLLSISPSSKLLRSSSSPSNPSISNIPHSLFPLSITHLDFKNNLLWFTLSDNNNNLYYLLFSLSPKSYWSFNLLKFNNLSNNISSSINSKSLAKKYNSSSFKNKILSRFHFHFKFSFNKNNSFHFLYLIDPSFSSTINFFSSFSLLSNSLSTSTPSFLDSFTFDSFLSRIKSFLLDKEFNIIPSKASTPIATVLSSNLIYKSIGSGLSSPLISEILYRSRISPFTPIFDIFSNPNLYKSLAFNIQYIVKLYFFTSSLSSFDPSIASWIKNFRSSLLFDTSHPSHIHPSVDINSNSFKFFVYHKNKDFLNFPVITNIFSSSLIYWAPDVQK